MGRPAISRRTFLGKRVEASRAGMMAMVFNLEVRSIKDFGSSPQSTVLRNSNRCSARSTFQNKGYSAAVQAATGLERLFKELRSYLLLLRRPVVPLPVVLLLVVPAPAADGCAECLRSCSHSLQSVGPGQDH